MLCAAQCEKAKDKAGRKPATVESLAVQTAVSETNGKGGMPSGGSADFYSIRLSGCLDNNEDKGKLYTPASTASKPGYFEVSRGRAQLILWLASGVSNEGGVLPSW